MPLATIDEIRALIGQEVGVSEWLTIGQDRIDLFADVTEDHQFIHIDPDAAARTPFGGTIAHGFLTLSLLSRMAADAMPMPAGMKMAANYGFDGIRFINPVRAGSRVRGRFTLLGMAERKPGEWRFANRVTVEIEGEERPALVAEWIGLVFL